MKKLTTLLTALALTSALNARADVSFEGNVLGTFQNAEGEAGLVHSINNGTAYPDSSEIRWGTKVGNVGDNWMVFQGKQFPATAPEVEFQVGDLTYFNGTTLIGSNLQKVQLNAALTFTAPPEISGNTESFLFPLKIVTTPNLGNDDLEDADSIVIDIQPQTTVFMVGDQSYTLKVYLKQGTVTGGEVVSDTTFSVYEGSEATAGLYGIITANVPDGGSTLMLLGAASALMGYLRRRM